MISENSCWGNQLEHPLAVLATSSATGYANRICAQLTRLYEQHRAEPRLANEDASVHLTPVNTRVNPDGEFTPTIGASVRGKDVYIVATLLSPFINPKNTVNDNIQELELLIHAAKQSSADSITPVIPYLPYARQDRRGDERAPVSIAKLMRGLERMGIREFITMDMHTSQVQLAVDTPIAHLYALPLIAIHYQEQPTYRATPEDHLVFAPDAGAFKRTVRLAELLDIGFAVGSKIRPGPGRVSQKYLVAGEIEGKHVIVLDDMIDTAGTIVRCVEEVRKRSPKSVSLAATHAVLSNPAIDRLTGLDVPVVVTDTIQQTGEGFFRNVTDDRALVNVPTRRELSWLTVLDSTRSFAQAVYNCHVPDSISDWQRNLEAKVRAK